MKSAKLILVFLLLIGPLTFSVATSPRVLWHQYNVSGTVIRASGSKENFSILLAGKTGAGSYQRLRGINVGRAQFPVGVTDSLGAFFVSVAESIRFDSLVVMALIPDREPVLGVPFSLGAATVFTEYETYTDADVSSDCSGCSTTPSTNTIATGYVYSCPEQSLSIPF